MRDISVAFDMGSSGGKVIAACMEEGVLKILDERVIGNTFVEVNHLLYWDIFRIFRDLKAALKEFSQLGRVVSIGVDGTSGCYCFVHRSGHLAGGVASDRDGHYDSWDRVLEKKITFKELYDRTGVFPGVGNCLNKVLFDYECGERVPGEDVVFLQLSGLMEYLLTGRMTLERSMAGASVMMDAQFKDWNLPLLEELGIPAAILPEIAEPADWGGYLLPSVAEETNCPDCRFVHTVEFDSSAAMISAPGFDKDQIYLSMGTTINPGVETDAPVISDLSYEYRYKNVPVWPGSCMLLSDIPGFFLLAECLKAWQKEDPTLGHGELVALASKETTNSFVDLYQPEFCVADDHMPDRVKEFLRKTGQEVPESIGGLARVLYESYAVTIAWSVDKLCAITGRSDYKNIAAISGGARNALLCQMIADASGRRVRAGDPTATCLGNLLVQFYACGKLDSLQAIRAAAEKAAPMTEYEPSYSAHLTEGRKFLTEAGFLKA